MKNLSGSLAKTVFFGSLLCSSWSEAQLLNYRVSSPARTDPNEVSIAINPTDPQNLIVGANLRYAFSSTDGGYTWTTRLLPTGTWGDPVVTFDGNGRAYFAHLSNPAGGYFIERLIVHRSSDGGATWYDSAGVGYRPPKQQDKEWITADITTSPYRDRLYMAWTEFDVYGSASSADSSRILFSRSTNGGGSWSSPITLSDRGGDCLDDDMTVEGAVPAVGPAGQVYVSWAGPLGIMFDRSFDGGETFGSDIKVADQPGGWAFDVDSIYRANGLPQTLCDVSGSPYRGRVYVVWSDQRSGPTDTDVYLASSDDQGTTWSTSRKVNSDGAGRHQFFPWAAIDPASGNLYLVYYDRRRTMNALTEVYLARSSDGGATFTEFPISQSPFWPRKSVFFGDYSGIAAMNGVVHPVWTRLDTTIRSIWTARITDAELTGVPEASTIPDATALLPAYPNPFNPSTRIPFRLSQAGHVTLEVVDVLGRVVERLVDSDMGAGEMTAAWNAAGMPSGIYVVRLRTREVQTSRQLVLLR